MKIEVTVKVKESNEARMGFAGSLDKERVVFSRNSEGDTFKSGDKKSLDAAREFLSKVVAEMDS